MKIYHSFWEGGYKELNEDLHNLHRLSVKLALENYGNITLITTKAGKEFLKDIPYTNIELFEEEIPIDLKDTWSISKLYAYRQIAKKGEPFFHIDYDVFLFKKLPKWFEKADLVCQMLENDYCINESYLLDVFLDNCPNKYLVDPSVNIAANAGILGGHNTEAMLFYANEALKLLLDEENIKSYWKNYNLKTNHWSRAVILEQFYYICCINKLGLKVTPLFDKWPSEKKAQKIGYTHLMGETKNDETIKNKIKKLLT
jgi:hypothetical protein